MTAVVWLEPMLFVDTGPHCLASGSLAHELRWQMGLPLQGPPVDAPTIAYTVTRASTGPPIKSNPVNTLPLGGGAVNEFASTTLTHGRYPSLQQLGSASTQKEQVQQLTCSLLQGKHAEPSGLWSSKGYSSATQLHQAAMYVACRLQTFLADASPPAGHISP